MRRTSESQRKTKTMAERCCTLVEIRFGESPMGIVVGYSSDGSVIVVGFACHPDTLRPGQAETSKKVKIGDKVVLVNDVEVQSIEQLRELTRERPVWINFFRDEQLLTNVEDYETNSEASNSVEIDPRAESSDFSDY